jgi:hypothetical protein
MLAQLELLQLLVRQSAAWQAIQLLGQQGAQPVLAQQGSASTATTHTACPLADDASSQCCEARRWQRKRARRADAEGEEVTSGTSQWRRLRARRVA